MQMPDRRRLLLIIATLAGLALSLAYFAGVFHGKVSDSQRNPTAPQLGTTITVQAKPEPITEWVPGTVQATDETLISSRIMAAVVRVNVRANAHVNLGDLLIELDDQTLDAILGQRRQELSAARAALEEATRGRDRANSLVASGNISQAGLDRANTEYRVAQANAERAARAVNEAEASLDYTQIRAPITGTVVDRFIEPGDTATPGRTLLRLYNPGRLRVEATLRESLVRHVGAGDKLIARIDALDVASPAVVEEIVPAADPGSRTFVLKALLPDLEGVFPGMFARLAIPLGDEVHIRIPAAAVHEAGQLDFVYVRTPAGDERRFVRLGAARDDGTVIVRSGLANDETLVVPPV
jgi:RND family efflux transporter MFP subunit